MGQTTNQIEDHIEKTRDDLGANLHELEYKVKEIGDWRHHFRSHPMTLLGVAFGGGVLLAAMVGGGRNTYAPPSTPRLPMGPHRQKVADTFDHMKDALIGVAASQLTNFVGELVPGFKDEFQRATSTRMGTTYTA